MELLYLWIEDYKNIYRQGFNFSPLYKFEFTPTKEENGKVIEGTLKDNITKEERETKETFYKDFFNVKNEKDDDKTQKGKITNVTAIVGENGAGKSSLIEILANYNINKAEYYNLIFVYKKNCKIKILSHIEINRYPKTSNLTEKIFTVLYSSNSHRYVLDIDNNRVKNNNNLIDLSPYKVFDDYSHLLRHPNKNIIDYIESQNLSNIMCNYSSIQKVLKPFILLPSIIEISLNYSQNHVIQNHNNTKPVKLDFITRFGHDLKEVSLEKKKNVFIINFFRAYIISITEIASKSSTIYLKLIKLIEDSNVFSSLDDAYVDNLSLFTKNLEKLFDAIWEDKILKKYFAVFGHGNSYKVDKICQYLYEAPIVFDDILFSKVYLNLKELEKNKDFSDFFTFTLTSMIPIIQLKLVQQVHKISNIYKHLSSGENNLVHLIACIYMAKNVSRKGGQIEYNAKNADSISILIDEGELGLHPQWQKQYLKILLETLPKIFPKKQIQLILTSHSPFLVSDLPKENVIFLEKEESTGLCKVSKLDNMKETFGANIHTLLTDSFFMKGGLVGEFAKSKINWAMELLLEKKEIDPKDKEKIRYIISCIGEPVIRHKLMQLYDEKVKFSVEDRIKQLEEELKKLKG
ncbi:AAA family ATPase (plasmid) [Bernardetia sp. Wsw4-3y2]|uniref:AAA family ATPase n=1 Tax=Bernardetia sp. Wsw4-3y2 TaxID=3127471 RepID=UPI0030D40721